MGKRQPKEISFPGEKTRQNHQEKMRKRRDNSRVKRKEKNSFKEKITSAQKALVTLGEKESVGRKIDTPSTFAVKIQNPVAVIKKKRKRINPKSKDSFRLLLRRIRR